MFSYTGAAYFLLSFSLGFLTYRFFQHWREKKDTTSKLLFYFVFLFFAFAFCKAIVGLFFANNKEILIGSIVFAESVQGLSALVAVCLMVYQLKLSKFFSWIAYSAVLFLIFLTNFFTIIKSFSIYLSF